tara:strand:+ start:14 stop:826 length:813 start_codon:yes stop_codon:yes gene_type:complete
LQLNLKIGKSVGDKMISVVQNFICTVPDRLKILEENLPIVGDVWGDYEFFVNFNDTVNLDEVHSLYKKYIPKLNFYNNLEKDWAATMLSLLNEVKTPYSVNINEDQQFLLTKDEWQNVVDEALVKHEVDFLLINKMDKYNKEPYVSGELELGSSIVKNYWDKYPSDGYDDGEYVYFHSGKYSPYKRITPEGVQKTDWFKLRFEEFLEKGEDCKHDIPIRYRHVGNFFEGYWDFENGPFRFPDYKFAIPKKDLIVQYDTIKEQKLGWKANL